MSVLQILGLAIVQGLTEFLPVSSSGHLILFSRMAHLQDQGIGIDIALHLGSLLAVAFYFKDTIFAMLRELFQTNFAPDFKRTHNRLAYLLVAASIPALIVGFYLRNIGLDALRDPQIIGFNILSYGVLLYLADRFSAKTRTTADITIKDAILIGLAQCFALIPGTSRSGITVTMARLLKINRVDAAKFSMLLAMPVIAAAGCLEVYRMLSIGDFAQIMLCFEALIYSFIASYVVIFLMMKWLKHYTYLPFALYRVILGLMLLCWL